MIVALAPVAKAAEAGIFAKLSPSFVLTTDSASAFSRGYDSCLRIGNREGRRIFTDFGNMYNCENAKKFGFVLLGAAVLANTEMDHNFQSWYGKHVRSDFTNDISRVSKVFGEGWIFISAMTASAITYRLFQEHKGLPECTLGEFTARTARGYFVGTPAVLLTQWTLGGNRPTSGQSYWRPFQNDKGVSGHAFVGAVPFITAAQMTDKPLVKGLFYVLSTFTAWSRVNDDAHYLSQALLGWYLAYLSVQAVSRTETSITLPRGLTVFPIAEGNAVGLGLHYRF